MSFDSFAPPDNAATSAPELSPVRSGGALSQGLRAGMSDMSGQTHALLGQGGELVGATDYAAAQRAQSVAAQQEAERVGPEVNTWEKAKEGGLRGAWDYGTGLLGRSLPSLAAGVAGAALMPGRGALAGIAGMTAATAPSTIGAQFEAQQNDPEQAKQDVLKRTLTGALAGTGEAAAMSVVPQMVGGKLFAKAAEGAAAREAMPFAQAVAHNVPEAVLGNAAAGNVSAQIGQQAASYLNPNRDTSQDDAEQTEAMIGGAAMGLPFAAAGIAGSMRGKSAGAPAAEPLVRSTEAERQTGVPLTDKVNGLGDFFKPAEPVTATEHADATLTPDDTPETVAVKDQQGAQAATDKATRTVDKLLADPIMAAHYDEIKALDPTSDAGQQQLADLNVKSVEARALTKSIDDGSAAVDDLYKHATAGLNLSEAGDGADKKIYETLATPEWAYLSDATKQTAASTVRKFMVAAEEKGATSPGAIDAVKNILGDNPSDKLINLHAEIGSDDPAKRDNFYGAVDALSQREKSDNDLLAVVRGALPPEMIDTVKTPQIKEFVAYMKNLAGEETTKNMVPNEAKVYKAKIDDKLQEMFGDKYDAISKAFAQHALEQSREAKVTPPDRTGAALDNEDEMDHTDAISAASPEDALTEQQTQDNYYGGGKDKANPEFVKHMDVHRAEFGDSESAHERLMRKAENENPSSSIDWMPAKDYAKEHGIPDEKLNELTGGKPEDHGMVVARGVKDPDAFTWKDVDAMKMDTSKSSHYESKSRIDTIEGGPILDAVRLVKETQKKMHFTGDENSMQRMSRALNEGVAAVSDHIGVPIHVPDETVVAIRSGGKVITAGDLRTLQDNALPADARKSMKGLRDKLAALKDERDAAPADAKNNLSAKIKDLHQQILDLQAKHPIDEPPEPQSETATTAELRSKQNKLEQGVSRLEKFIAQQSTKKNLSRSEKRDVLDAKFKLTRAQDRATKLDEAITNRESRDAALAAKEEGGIRETDPEAQVHHAAAEHGDEGLGKTFIEERAKRGEGVLSNNYGTLVDKNGNVTPIGREALKSRLSAYEAAANTKPARAIVANLKTLVENFDRLTPTHQAELVKIAKYEKYEKISDAAPIIENLTDKYGSFDGVGKSQAEKTGAWQKMAGEGGAQHKAILENIARSTDPKGIQSALMGVLKDKRPNEHKQAVIAAMNDRISSLIEKNPDAAYGLLTKGMESPAETAAKALGKNNTPNSLSREETDSSKGSTAAQQKAVVDHINKVTGNSVDVNAAARLLYAGSYIEGGADHRPAINVSVHAMDPTSVGYHESLHWLADDLRKNGDPKVFAALSKVADSPYVRNFLRNKFKDQPEALKQITDSAEERVAYMYQLHANGDLKLGDRGRTLLENIGDYIKKVFGIWSNDQRAMHIMDYFHSGEYAKNIGERNVLHSQLMEQGRNKTLDHLHKAAEPLIRLMDATAGIGSARIQDMNIPALSKLVDMTRKHDTKEGDDAGYLPAAGIAMRTFRNKLVNRMGEFAFADADEAFAAAALGKAPKNDKQARLMNGMRDTLDEMHGYLKDAGVNVGDRGFGKNYMPRQWDAAYVAGHQAKFKAMLDKYIKSGEYTGTPEALMLRLMRDEGSEMESADAQARPGDQHVKKRELSFITPEDAAPFLEKNAMHVLTSYIRQGTRRAEWSRRFELKAAGEDQTPLEKIRAAAVKQGATSEQMKTVDQYLSGITGQLGSDVRPETRKLFGQMMVYQNLRLLSMGFFSSLSDPIGVGVRGGDLKDVFNNFKRGIMEIPRGFQKNPKYDEGYHLAEDMGVIDNAVLQHVMGASYGLNAVGNKARMINETLFKWNLMEQMNTSQRVGATEAAMGFLKKHAKGDFNEHSMRYLGELGLKPSDIKMIDGRVAARVEDFEKAGLKPAAAEAAHLKMKAAINQWVDSAVLRPDQSQKAIWMNDPHFSVIAHMKQFAFSFQDTILKRVLHEAKHGNYSPAVAMAGYIPVMLAADLMKGAIQGGGSQPSWKQDWSLGDYLSSAIQRAGLLGVGQFGVDAFKDLHQGGTGLGALGGPTINQLVGIVSMVGGSRQFSSTVIDSMPANALLAHYLSNLTSGGNKSGGEKFAPTELNNVD